MQNLTDRELNKINRINEYTRQMGLGTKFQELITASNDGSRVGTPVNAVNASAILTISGDVSNGETVTIGTDIYEFRTDAGQVVTAPGNIPVDIQVDTALEALETTIEAEGTALVTVAPGEADTLVVTASIAGVSGNAIPVSEDMTNGGFSGDVTTLIGGVDGTIGNAGDGYVDDTYLYKCVANNTVSGKNWRRVSLGSAY